MNSVMPSTNNTMILMTRSTSKKRSISPMTPSPSREIRGIRLFRAISRKLARRSNEDLNFNADADSRSSSSDSCSSSTKKEENLSGDSGFRSVSPNHMSSSSSETGSDIQNLNLNTRSQSCNNTKETKRKNSKKSTPKRILRSPVTYTYVRGLSGLPTQRIPKNQSRMYMNSPCGCSIQYMAGLNR
ncbi:uncharacterized protein BDFB_010558 [Asbolus verrucosus]|uniref:DUF4797 domain-containing protein n=1 Tax=Asbolus verrucosus TaxID=1661398 RepID=A0A482WBQ5_ASBVE|nr:uncharacterized protein BDFB_010558 [Asbolus verrucosus]